MKKNKVILLTAAFLFGLSSFVYAGYMKGFTVTEIEKGQVTIQKGEDKPIHVEVGKKKFRVGDKVKYDAERGKLQRERRKLEGC